MLESIIKDKIAEYLEIRGKIGARQHGFIKGRSCLTNLLEFFEVVTKNLDKGEPIDVIYLDFQKSFDKVPCRRLLNKLEANGIRSKVLAWIEDWLTDVSIHV